VSFKDRLIRQLDLLPIEKLGQKVTIIGAGAIGSFAALSIAKMGFCNIEVWDYDTVDIANMNCQFYRTKDIGSTKVDALKELVHDFTDVTITTKCEPWDISKKIDGIVIMAVDSMKVRAELWSYCKDKMSIPYVLDARMGAESILFYTMRTADDTSWYDKTLYSDEDAERERCTAKSTMYTVNLIAGLIGKAMKDIINEHPRTKVVMWNVKDNDYVGFNTGDSNA